LLSPSPRSGWRPCGSHHPRGRPFNDRQPDCAKRVVTNARAGRDHKVRRETTVIHFKALALRRGATQRRGHCSASPVQRSRTLDAQNLSRAPAVARAKVKDCTAAQNCRRKSRSSGAGRRTERAEACLSDHIRPGLRAGRPPRYAIAWSRTTPSRWLTRRLDRIQPFYQSAHHRERTGIGDRRMRTRADSP